LCRPYLGGVWVVLLGLAHLDPVGSEHQPVADEVLEGGLVEERRREHHQRVEPAARLLKEWGGRD